MKLTDSYDGSNDPFEGDRTLLWTSLPAGAKVNHAKLTLTPVSAASGVLFQEQIGLTSSPGDWGATKASGTQGGNAYVEVDFHKPRTLVSVTEKGLDDGGTAGAGASLQIDMGGVFVEVNLKGAIKTPTDPTAFSLPKDGTLPSLKVSKFRLVAQNAGTADISEVTIKTVPSNISVRLGKMGAFWTRTGDLVSGDTSPDFADVLQVFLNNATVTNGYNAVPVVIHSDSIARLDVSLQVEFVQQASVMPDGVKEVVLPFDFSSVPNAQPGTLSVSLPPNSQVVPGVTTARVLGAFDDTRVVYGPTGDVSPAGTVTVTANDSQAQFFVLDAPVAATALDVLINPQPPGITLAVDLRNDLDGKPDSTSLLGTPAQATVPSKPNQQPVWINVPLGAGVHLQAKDQAKYWLVLQSLQGQADWSVQPAAAGKPVMQHTQDGGLSWRETPAPAAASPPSAFFRLRQVPAAFQVPVDLQIGSGTQAQRVKLDRFQPLGRVDFTLDVPEVANGFNTFLTGAPPACSDAESLANGNFDQWTIVGNDPGTVTTVPGILKGVDVGAIAASADGKVAYIAASANRQTALLRLDVACNKLVAPAISLQTQDPAQRMVLYPDQSKALLMGGLGTLTLVDLLKSAQIKSVSGSPTAISFSPDGSQVYALSLDPSSEAIGSLLSAVETTTFEQVMEFSGGSPLSGAPVDMAAAGNRLYVLTSILDTTTNVLNGGLFFVDPQSLLADGDSLPTGTRPKALAASPDGKRIVIVNGDKTVAIVSTESKSVSPVAIDVDEFVGAAVVISSDSTRAFVATIPGTATGFAITIVDLVRRVALPSIDGGLGMTSIAITPQGDQLYVGRSSGDIPLSYLPIGTPVPADWFLTSGEVTLRCLPQGSSTHIVAELALLDRTAPPQPNALSQVAPISGGCTYDFSFEGLTDDLRAVAEVIWRGQGCTGIKTDSVAIPVESVQSRFIGVIGPAPPPPVVTLAPAAAVALTVSRPLQLQPAGARLTAPAGANSAEVRFTVPDGIALIAAVSLKGTSQSLLNTGLQPQPQSQPGAAPDPWTISPATARGFLITQSGSAVVLRNTGPDTADLVQTATATAGQPFNFEFTGRTLTLQAKDNPKVSLHWLKSDGSEATSAVTENIAPETLNSHPMSGKVPDGATQVEVHLSLPSGTALSVNQVSLQMPKTTSVPVSFVAQSPGQLRVSAAQVGYDTTQPAPPPVPSTGVCPPTPPGQQPGPQPAGTCHCSCCQSETQMTKATPAVTPAGRPMTLGVCADCGNQLVTGGGTLVTGALQPLPVRVVPAHPLLPVSAEPLPLTLAPSPVLTDVMGIGKTRAQQLTRAGIKSVQDLAAADPEHVAKVVIGVSADNAALLVEHAKKLLATNV
jgi:hypothetical protein